MDLRLQEIISLDELRELMLFFYEAVGISVGVMDEDQNWLVTIGWQHICTDFHRANPECRKNCLLSEHRIKEYLDSKDYLIYPCPNGLIEVAIPILLDQTTLGFFFLGQFLHQPPDLDYFRRQAIAYGFNIDAYLQALERVPVVSRQRVDYLMRFFARFFNLLTRIGAENQKRLYAEDEIQKAKDELEVRVEERTRELNLALLEVGDLAAQLNASLQQIESLAVTDSLTDTYNRRKFDEIVAAEHGHEKHGKPPFSLIMLDIDHFKKVNDEFGHSTGDEVLKCLCRLIRGLIRQGDLLIRWGGEEFILLLPATEIDEAGPFAERVRLEVEQENFPVVGKITISLGVAQLRKGDSINALLKRVDNALYQAKQRGRNRVVKCTET
ncbi:diguanylate cyclase [uncultured Desulfuromusa sp.]|uniref:diguanylate cyclase n=1 Tax=uncultured Desulfuromusa sp. TaxID=219183 RepID=UPI002AA6C2A0|nr:diguanylate cyclase [uncultured Desulfuromusa sp.]